MDWKFLFPSWTVPRRKREELAERAELTGKARESRSFLWGIIEVGVEAEIIEMPDRLALELERSPSGAWFVTSPDYKGLLVAKQSPEEALADVPRALSELIAARP